MNETETTHHKLKQLIEDVTEQSKVIHLTSTHESVKYLV